MPTPAEPSTVTRTHRSSITARSKAARRMPSSRSRPTIGPPTRRWNPSAAWSTARRLRTMTGSSWPLTEISRGSPVTTASRTSRQVESPTSVSPGSAACCRRAATVTASPVARLPPALASPTTAVPVLTPTRISISTPRSVRRSSLSEASVIVISAAARTARMPSSSWTTGTPKTATTASPMNFSTDPPCRSRTALMESNHRPMIERNASGSRRSPRPVEPVTSANTTVTTLRASRAASGTASVAPHDMQNRATSGFGVEQLGQATIRPSLGCRAGGPSAILALPTGSIRDPMEAST